VIGSFSKGEYMSEGKYNNLIQNKLSILRINILRKTLSGKNGKTD
jgi:hypothetical protein